MSMIYYLIAFAAGLGITLQTTLNSQLARGLGGDSVTAALFSFSAGAFTLGIYSLLRGDYSPRLRQFLPSHCGAWQAD